MEHEQVEETAAPLDERAQGEGPGSPALEGRLAALGRTASASPGVLAAAGRSGSALASQLALLQQTSGNQAVVRLLRQPEGGAGAATAPPAPTPAPPAQTAQPAGATGTWVAPFDLGTKTDTGDATAALVDIKNKLNEWKDVGYENEMKIALGAVDKALESLYGPGRALTADEATRLAAAGLLAQAAYQSALKHFQEMISAELAKYTGVEAQDAVDAAAELLHQEYMRGEGEDKIAAARDAVNKGKELVGEVKKYVEWASKTKSVIKAAAKLEDVKKGLEGIEGKLGTVVKVLELADSVATLAGKVGEKPGQMASDIGKLKAGFQIVDFVISKSNVPLIGTVWSEYIKPAAETALKRLQTLDEMIDKATRMNQLDEWWQRASRGMAPPSLDEEGLAGLAVKKYFPGGQPMLNFMWSLFRGAPPDSVPGGIEEYFVKFRKQLSAGLPEEEKIQTDDAWYNLWNVLGTTHAVGLLDWVKKNRDSVWAMLYGSLPHP